MEILVVVAIIGIISLAMVPFAQVTFIRYKEDEFQSNLHTVRKAIKLWHDDCYSTLKSQLPTLVDAIPDCYLYPPDIGSLTKTIPYPIKGTTAVFYPKFYLKEIPIDPFVNGAIWTQFYASETVVAGNTTSTYEYGKISGAIGTGVFDISGHPATDTRRGFVLALDGTNYSDW